MFLGAPQAVEAIHAGANDYLVKPVSIAQLGRGLDRALEVQSRSTRKVNVLEFDLDLTKRYGAPVRAAASAVVSESTKDPLE